MSKIKSDGGSSSYYDLAVSDELARQLKQRQEEGTPFIRTEELIKNIFGNDFDFGTLFKSLVRAYLQTEGGGKEGNDLHYEINKVKYYADKIEVSYGSDKIKK